LHQSHDFDKEEFDKEIVAPRPEFRIGRPAACFPQPCPLVDKLSSAALNGLSSQRRPRLETFDLQLAVNK
jgi:hypothetical protein